MSNWEQSVKDHFAKLPLTFQGLLESIERTRITEAVPPSENKSLQQVIATVTDLGYDYTIVRDTTVKVTVPNDQRAEVMSKLIDVLVPLGFTHDPARESRFGLLKKLSRKEGSAFVVVKPSSSVGRAATLGAEYEVALANKIEERYGRYGVSVTVAGFGSGSDLTISGKNGKMTVEVKTSSGADFGQFRLRYDLANKYWTTSPTASFLKNEALFTGLFNDYLADYLNEHAKFPDLSDPKLKIRKGFVTGISPSLETGDYKKELESTWYDERADIVVPVDFEKIAGYYAAKGDQYIQIGGRGLYSLDTAVDRWGIPSFQGKLKDASIRFRIKPEMGFNGHHSFTVAIKLNIEKSHKNLDSHDLDAVIEWMI